MLPTTMKLLAGSIAKRRNQMLLCVYLCVCVCVRARVRACVHVYKFIRVLVYTSIHVYAPDMALCSAFLAED